MPQPVKIELLLVDHATAKLQDADTAVQKMEKDVKRTNTALKDTDATADRLAKGVKRLAAAFAFQEIVRKIAAVRGEFQQLEVSLRTMTGSATTAKALLSELTQTAATTPFQLTDIAKGAKQLLAYGFAADQINGTLIKLGDIASGLSVPLGDLVYLYGTTKAQGRLYAQDLLQFTGRGIPMISELAQQFGVAESQVKELVSQGKVGFPEVEKVITHLTAAGGRFGGLMKAQSQTIVGQISNIQDSIDAMLNDIGQQNEGLINASLQGVSYLVGHYEQFGRILLGLAGTYGTYRTALILTAAAEKAEGAMKAVGAMRTALLTKAQKALNAVLASNPYVLIATALAALVGVMLSAKTNTERLREAQQAYGKQLSESIAKEEEHRRRMEQLTAVAADESVATDTRRKALQELEQAYPEIFAKYDTEYNKLRHIKAIKLQIAQIEDARSLKAPHNELQRVEDRIATLQAKAATAKHQTMQSAHGAYTLTSGGLDAAETMELKMLQERQKALAVKVQKAATADYFQHLTGISNDELEKQIRLRQNLLAKMATDQKKYGKIAHGAVATQGVFTAKELQYQLNRLRTERSERNAPRFSSSALYAKAKKAYTAALHAYNAFVRSTNNALTQGEFAEHAQRLKADLAAAKKEMEQYAPIKQGGGKESPKSAAAKGKQTSPDTLKKEEEKKAAELLRLQARTADLRAQLTQSEIDNMADGAEKRKRQVKLNYEKERQQLLKSRSELLSDMRKSGQYSPEAMADVAATYNKLLQNTAQKAETSHLHALLQQYKGYFEQRKAIEEQYASDRQTLQEGGASDDALGALDSDKAAALDALDASFAQRQEGFTQWVEQISALSLSALRSLMAETEAELSKLQDKSPLDKRIPVLRAKVAALRKEMDKAGKFAPNKQGLADWRNLTQVLGQVRQSFVALSGDADSSVAQLLGFAETLASSTITMIGGIQKIATAAAGAISAVEKASIILGIIAAALQITQAIATISDKLASARYDKMVEKYNEINKLRDAVNAYHLAVMKARDEEKKWFSSNGLDNLTALRKRHDEVKRQYDEKLNERQVKYQNKKAGLAGLGKVIASNIAFAVSPVLSPIAIKKIWKQKRPDIVAAKDNLRIQTQHRTWFRREKTRDLQDYLKEKGFGKLFDESGMINKEVAKYALDNLKLVGNTRDTLEKLVKLREEYEQYQKELRKYVNTLYEPLVDNFVNGIWDWLQSGKNALDSFKQYASQTFTEIGKTMIKSLVLSKIFGEGDASYQSRLTQLYDQFNQGKLTQSQLYKEVAKVTEGLMATAQTQLPIIQGMAKEYSESMKRIGIDLTKQGNAQEAAQQGAFRTMTQDQGTKLEGMFTSGLRHWIAIDEHTAKVSLQMTVAEGHLRHIADNTRHTVTVLKNITHELFVIQRDGIKMK